MSNLILRRTRRSKPCIGCNDAHPTVHFLVQVAEKHDLSTEWEEIDVCNDCAGKLTAEDLHRLVDLPEDEAEESRGGPDDRRGGYASSSPSLSEEMTDGC